MGELGIARAGQDGGLQARETLNGLREGDDLSGADKAVGDSCSSKEALVDQTIIKDTDKVAQTKI